MGLAPPTEAQLAEENHNAHALFRHIPRLKTALAWRQLGNFPTPIHCGSVISPTSGQLIRFLVKREDLSSPLYGGNKVRGLQHQIGIIEARTTKQHSPNVIVVGSGGSNQVVATTVHMEAAAAGLAGRVKALWISKDKPDLDNTLNMLSALSFSLAGATTWGGSVSDTLRELYTAWRNGDIIIPTGGNNAAGVLGQVSATLELAEQIANGECEDVDTIVLAVGSSCTISGIIIGVALAQHLGIRAFQKPNFKIKGIAIHQALAAARRLGHKLYIDRTPFATLIPSTISNTLVRTCGALSNLGGPDVLKEARRVLKKHVEVVDDPHYVGLYGGHSEPSLEASRAYDATGTVHDEHGEVSTFCGAVALIVHTV